MVDSPKMHVEIKEYLKDAIQSGRLKEGDALPSEHELATQFGINRNWPRRALRELEVEGYVLRSQGRRSTVAPMYMRRQSLSIGRTPTLAIALPEYQDRFDRTLTDAFMAFASLHDVHSLIYKIRLEEQEEEEFLLRAPEIGISGLAMWPQHDTPRIARSMMRLRQRHFPLVQIDRHVRGSDTDYVVTDNEALGYMLTRALMEKGHTCLAFASVFDDVSSVRDRYAGFRRAHEERGLSCDEKYHKRMWPGDISTIRAAVTELMSYREAPTGFLCIYDYLASTVMTELDRLGYRVPEHVELAAVDDVHQSQTTGIPMITARQQGEEMGRLAAELLLSRLYDPELPPTQHHLQPHMTGE